MDLTPSDFGSVERDAILGMLDERLDEDATIPEAWNHGGPGYALVGLAAELLEKQNGYRQALLVCRRLIKGEMIEHAVVDANQPDLSLGNHLDAVLK